MSSCLRRIFAICFATFLYNLAHTQGVDSMMNVYGQQYPQQKVYVHFDKSVYRAGETVWFKAYVFAGFEPSGFSQTLYAELIDKDGLVIQKKIYPVVENASAGNFELPGTQNTNLSFRAYTQWMMNFDTSFVFKKELTILGEQNNKVQPAGEQPATPGDQNKKAKIEASATQIDFLPEGGDLVNGVESLVAFKAVDAKGKPVKVSGELKNTRGEPVISFKSAHNGMGTFLLTPAGSEKYTAVVTDEFGKELKVLLPDVKLSGVVLHISSISSKKVFIIKRSEADAQAFPIVNIVAHMAQRVVYRARVPLAETSVNSGSISTEALPSGIMQVTIFNNNWEPLAERIVFVNNDNYQLEATLETPVINLEKRGKNVVELSVADTLMSNMSISVTDAEIGYKGYENNIISGLLLTGDLRGNVYNPAYYFKNTDDTTLRNLDLVMLTNGWRKFNWSNIVRARKPFLKYPVEQPLSLIGKVFGVNPSRPIQYNETMTVILQARDSSTRIFQVPKTGQTEFALRNFVFYDTLKIFYQFDKDRNLAANTSLLFENGLLKTPRTVLLPPFPLTNIDSIAIKRAKYFALQYDRFGDGSKVNVLQEVIVKARVRDPKDELDKKYASGLFSGGDAQTFDFVNDNKNAFASDIFQYLQGRVAGLQISQAGGGTSLQWRGSATTVFLNELQTDVQQIASIPVTDIAYIKVFRPPFFGASGGGAGGAIAIYTKKGSDQPAIPGKGLDRSIITGYNYVKQFYSPNYDDPQTDVNTDLRSTLYWNPNVYTGGQQQKLKFEFFNNDFSRAFRIVLEGVNEYGKLIRIEKVLQ